ncbi:MAG TPA: tRNA pseudouridine(54/55) synthase Pus10 [Candidatus Thermoplasmatota archaeon]|nr:tRNA pseudouridine(54/55) synthase Pus10 [Candidatus Thermoplasmatota archaeon]
MTRDLESPPILEQARRAVEDASLCDHCLGRLFGRVETGLTNPERAAIVRRAAGLEAGVASAACEVCEGLFDELEKFASLAADALAGIEFSTYLVGTRLDPLVSEREGALRAKAQVDAQKAENVNTELNREIGKRLQGRVGGTVDFKDPDVAAIIDTRFDVVELQHGGLFLYGRYRKHERGIPQTVWPCRRCRGRGCVQCDGTGKLYATSVQELVEEIPRREAGATESAFHGAGREDIDARCLGPGRPFVLELKDPRKRALDCAALEKAINAHAAGRVEVLGLRPARKAEVVAVKDFRGTKEYRAVVAFEREVGQENLNKAVAALRGSAIAQRTPSRVEHRRADKVRDRTVVDAAVEAAEGARAVIRVRGDAGLYIKELVSGDEGRTTPSLAELVGVPARVTELDIIDVQYDDAGAPGDAPPVA